MVYTQEPHMNIMCILPLQVVKMLKMVHITAQHKAAVARMLANSVHLEANVVVDIVVGVPAHHIRVVVT